MCTEEGLQGCIVCVQKRGCRLNCMCTEEGL